MVKAQERNTLPLPLHVPHYHQSFYMSLVTAILWLCQHRNILFGTTVCILLPIIIPLVHLSLFSIIWSDFAVEVDRDTCSCSCWDTVFKGTYESSVPGYKNIYFNCTWITLKIWTLTVIAVISLYESFKRVLHLLHEKCLRFAMAVLFISSVYPHYYSWWDYFNFWNDEFYNQWNHQLFFTLTELSSTVIVLYLLDVKNPVTPKKLLIIIEIAVVHLIISGYDQFVTNVVHGEGALHQVLRDIGLFVPDILHCIIPLVELIYYARGIGVPPSQLITTSDFVSVALLISAFWVLLMMFG